MNYADARGAIFTAIAVAAIGFTYLGTQHTSRAKNALRDQSTDAIAFAI